MVRHRDLVTKIKIAIYFLACLLVIRENLCFPLYGTTGIFLEDSKQEHLQSHVVILDILMVALFGFKLLLSSIKTLGLNLHVF